MLMYCTLDLNFWIIYQTTTTTMYLELNQMYLYTIQYACRSGRAFCCIECYKPNKIDSVDFPGKYRKLKSATIYRTCSDFYWLYLPKCIFISWWHAAGDSKLCTVYTLITRHVSRLMNIYFVCTMIKTGNGGVGPFPAILENWNTE